MRKAHPSVCRARLGCDTSLSPPDVVESFSSSEFGCTPSNGWRERQIQTNTATALRAEAACQNNNYNQCDCCLLSAGARLSELLGILRDLLGALLRFGCFLRASCGVPCGPRPPFPGKNWKEFPGPTRDGKNQVDKYVCYLAAQQEAKSRERIGNNFCSARTPTSPRKAPARPPQGPRKASRKEPLNSSKPRSDLTSPKGGMQGSMRCGKIHSSPDSSRQRPRRTGCADLAHCRQGACGPSRMSQCRRDQGMARGLSRAASGLPPSILVFRAVLLLGWIAQWLTKDRR